jgi:hypothetical protein
MRLLFLFALLVVGLGAAIYGVSRPRGTAERATVEADIGDAHFSYRAAYARDPATAAGGLADRLAFIVKFPNFEPLGAATPRGARASLTERSDEAVFITIAQADEAVDPANRPALLYSRFLEGDASAGPGGLIARKFESGSPFELEQLYLAPPDGRVFFARCPRLRGSEDALLDMCLWVFRTRSLDVELRFAPTLLEHWEILVDKARALLRSIAARDLETR